MPRATKLKAFFLLLCCLNLIGCGYFSDSFEKAAELDKSGQSLMAIQAYQKYLKNHPTTQLNAYINYRIAKNYETLSDYNSALNIYSKICADYPRTDEELHSLLAISSLYRDKLKNNSKAAEYEQKSFSRYLDNVDIRDAVQFLIDGQYSSATALYTQKNFKGAADFAEGIFQAYPTIFIAPERRAKITSFIERARRAESISKDDSDLIILKSEGPFNRSYENDFETDTQNDEKGFPSPDGNFLVSRRKAGNGTYYLYVAKIPKKTDEVKFKLIDQTFGANLPSWSPDSKNLVYVRTARGLRKLEKTNISNINQPSTQTLFFTKSDSLGTKPVYHPTGNKIAFVYSGHVWLINSNGTNKSLLKTTQKLNYTALLEWSIDGTMIRCRQESKDQKIDELLQLDVTPGAL